MKSFIVTLALVFIANSSLFAQISSIQVEVVGQGEPVLLLPGFTCPGEVWLETVEKISQNRECHIVTYAGFGDVPAIDSSWLQTVKKDIDQYIRKNGFSRLSIVGHSMGGTLALWLASEKQFDIEKLLIIDALPCMGAMMIPNYSSDKISYDTQYNNNLLKMNDEEFRGMAMNMAVFMSKSASKHQQIVDWMIKADRKTYVYGYTDLLKLDLREDIKNIESQVVILAAANPSKSMVEGVYNNQFAALKSKEIVYIENSAHFIMFDQFETYMNELKQLLN
ncbi:alpha/beta fold hydrolase [Marinifilum sp. D714]|uniref:alpha/beta fold hydrolase n=1 Tax=Marinifilum sp. D714 TaxID=2937523 RepID=UPI0027BE1297|nr:alpha/beta hydrolase [Marinifilum sp. D714]MDQ2180694.1 alpha/beta hydrolase [Marinifilum sp. D714]